MAAVDSDESDFGDDMALVPSMKAHTGGQGLGAASAPAAAVPLKKVALHRPHMADVLLAERMRIVPQYDLTTVVGMDKFAQEIIWWKHGVRLCAPRCRRFEMARGPGASRKSISQARGACTCCGQRHVQDEVAW